VAKDVVIIDRLSKVIQNKYEAVRVMAKEARRINSVMIRSENADVFQKPTSMALKRLLENRIKYEFAEEEGNPKDMHFEDDDE
jgi:DNA-directed RNA polymerase subunit K/omega